MISVEKNLFIKVLNHYADSSVEEAKEVLSLKESFPYSQLLHALSARLAKDHGFSTQQAELQLAAVYAADRGVLKEVMTEETIVLNYTTTTSSAITEDTPVIAKPVSIFIPPPVSTSTASTRSSDLAEEVMHDLERLNQLRHNFEKMFDDSQPVIHQAQPELPVATEETEKDDDAAEFVSTAKSRKERIKELAKATLPKDEPEETKSKKARIIELAKAAQAKDETETAEEPEQKKVRKKKTENSGEELIEEIANKEELTPEGEKQIQQLQIIEQFIKTQPSLTQTKEKPFTPPSGDLSTIKTGEFGDNIVSETLVEILVKQGKKDKAIEVLKKLIWKFPQKKAYFAAQIEDLRK
jgi:hypothetical protein